MKISFKLLILIFISFLSLMIAVGIGSVNIPINQIINIISHNLFNTPLDSDISASTASIIWNIRLPRSIMAFIVGAGLAASGTVMQSILRNPLASSYTLGVSSGASLGAAIMIVFGINIPLMGAFGLPFVGFIGGLITVLLVMAMTSKIDKSLSNQTIILVGMVFSLFVNALLTLFFALARQFMEQLILWQLGSFAGQNWSHVGITLIITVISIFLLMRYSQEMDIMTFGEDQAQSIGVNLKKIKILLISIASLITGSAVAFVGIIGFVDLIAPHVVRKIFGTTHKLVIPTSALFGGTFMVLSDLIGRVLVSPSELPVGAVTALIGAPFFAYIFFKKRG